MASIRSTSDPVEDSADGLESLLRGESPAERERIIRAWHELLQGDPDSMPVQFALVTRGIGRFLAATVAEAHGLVADAAAARSEVSQARNAFALEADRKIGELTEALEAARRLPGEIEAAVETARAVTAGLAGATRDSRRTTRVGWILFLAFFATGAMGIGYWFGGEWRARQEQDRIGVLLHRWQQGDSDAYRELIGRVGHYREIHQIPAAGEGSEP